MFIQLTSNDHDEPVYISIAALLTFWVTNKKTIDEPENIEHTLVRIDNGVTLHVKETPSQIMAQAWNVSLDFQRALKL